MTDADEMNVLGTRLTIGSPVRDKVVAVMKIGLVCAFALAIALYFAFSESNPISDMYRDAQTRELSRLEAMQCKRTGEAPGDYLHTFIVFKCPDGTTPKVLVTRTGGPSN